MVVGGAGQQIVREGVEALDAGLMKVGGRCAELFGVEANVIAREQDGRSIERGVFHRFRRRRRGQLLETYAGVLQTLAFTPGRARTPGFTAEPAGQAVEHRPVRFAQDFAGTVHGLAEKRLVPGRTAKGAYVGAVHREMHDQRLQGPANGAEGQVAGHEVVPGHLQQGLGDAFEISGQGTTEDLLTGQLCFLAEVGGPLAVTVPEFGQCLRAPWILLQQ
ncbi:hypothetical protein D3C80_708650 [compost metagenome]